MKYYFAIDVETTGQFIDKNAMIAFGCTVMNEKMEELENFETYMEVPEGKKWEKRCVDEFWSKQEKAFNFIKNRMKSPSDEMLRFEKWLDKIDLKYGSELVVLSDTSCYDYAWINYYLGCFTGRPSIYYRLKSIEDDKKQYEYRRIWDTNSIYHGALMEKKKEYIEWNLEKELECKNKKWENDHNSLNDARNIASNYIIFITKTKKNE